MAHDFIRPDDHWGRAEAWRQAERHELHERVRGEDFTLPLPPKLPDPPPFDSEEFWAEVRQGQRESRHNFLTGTPPTDQPEPEASMKLSEAYPSKFLAADDLAGHPVTVTIASARVEDIGQGQDKDRKIVLTFVGKTKQLVCNKTNAKTIAKLWGDDTDLWIGKPIILAPREVEFQGDMVWAIRVSLQKPVEGAQQIGRPVQSIAPAAPIAPNANPTLDEDVPF